MRPQLVTLLGLHGREGTVRQRSLHDGENGIVQFACVKKTFKDEIGIPLSHGVAYVVDGVKKQRMALRAAANLSDNDIPASAALAFHQVAAGPLKPGTDNVIDLGRRAAEALRQVLAAYANRRSVGEAYKIADETFKVVA